MRCHPSSLLIPAALLVACATTTPPAPWPTVAADALTPAQQTQFGKALAARDELGKRLLGALQQALANGAPAAIAVCTEQAPGMAQAVSEQHGLRIGRTALRRRNQDNAPPAWLPALAADTLAGQFAGPRRELGVLLPIPTMPLCVQCHGPTEQLAPGVAAALAQRYPHDAATGFAPGQTRGWFWIEVPAGE
jgi:hypothetical protein